VLAALAVALLALLAIGCEHRSQQAPAASEAGGSLVVTAGYGERELLSTRVAPGQSVMRGLRGATDVRTVFAGGFVSEMLGVASDPSGPADWFFYVDGIGSPVGAKDVTVDDGDAIWWDHRDWGDLPEVPAVVGSWPAPLARPGGGGPDVAADPPLRDALAEAGARLTAGASPWRARVGASDDLARRDPAWRRALDDPERAGLTVAIEGGAVTALPPGGGRRVAVPGARALAAAVPTGDQPEEGVLVVVAGLDAAAADAAARAIVDDPAILRQRYAIAFDGEGVPLRAGGRSAP
jgi:hypothetical protein